MTLIQGTVLAVVALILGLFVVRPLMLSSGRKEVIGAEDTPLALPPSEGQSVQQGDGRPRVLNGEIDDDDLTNRSFISVNDTAEAERAEPMDRLRRLIEERQTETVEILRGWMEAEEEEQV